MSISPKISPKILGSIASLYNDVNRIFMEYIDNSIDNADVHYFSERTNSYSKRVKIDIQVIGNNYKDGQIIITDNCNGITNFTKVVESIGDSEKKNNRFTNGQFGFGIYSFMAACSTLIVSSKTYGEDAMTLELNRKQFDKKSTEDVKIPSPKILKDFPHNTGTRIILKNFDKDSWKDVNSCMIKEEIEKHFELILGRGNIVINVIERDGKNVKCDTFDYDKYEGEVYDDVVHELMISSGRRYKVRDIFSIENGIHVFIKITKDVVLNKPPSFVLKGRRICEIKDVKSFKSSHKSDIWGHANVTGYIDLKDFLEPNIARVDFKSNEKARALYNYLGQLEELIIDFINKANEHTDEKHYQQLEDALNKALSKLAKADSMLYRKTYLLGGEKNLSGGSIGAEYVDSMGSKDYHDGQSGGEGKDLGENEGLGKGHKEGGNSIPGGSLEGKNAMSLELFDDSIFKGREKKRSGFNIHISDADPQVDAESGLPLRSLLSGDEIIIYKKHDDFKIRLSHTRQGGSKITDRLLAYIAGEITVHYKDEFYNKHQNGQPEYSKKMFISLVEFIYQLEGSLSALSGKSLSEL